MQLGGTAFGQILEAADRSYCVIQAGTDKITAANEAVDSWCRSDSRPFQVKSYLLLLKQVVRNPLIS
jgi:hypothetical protein